MVKAYSPSARLRVDVDGLIFTISPLTFDQKAEIQALAASGDLAQGLKAAKLAVKYAVKDVEGIEAMDGSEYHPEVADDGLADDAIDVLFNIEQSDKLAFTCLNLIQSVPQDFINPHTGEKLKGVKMIRENTGKKPRKKSGA